MLLRKGRLSTGADRQQNKVIMTRPLLLVVSDDAEWDLLDRLLRSPCDPLQPGWFLKIFTGNVQPGAGL